MNTGTKRKISIAICAIFIAVTFVSLFYIVKEENHHCTGEDCPVCACVHQAEQTLRNLGTGTAITAAVNQMPAISALAAAGVCLFIPCISLVSQKVRLND